MYQLVDNNAEYVWEIVECFYAKKKKTKEVLCEILFGINFCALKLVKYK